MWKWWAFNLVLINSPPFITFLTTFQWSLC
jgi:hypothetical protein